MAKQQLRKDKRFSSVEKEDKHEHGVRFLVHKDIVNTGMSPSLHDQLQNVIDQTPKKDILVVQGDWIAKVGRNACGNWQGICGPFCNDDTNERGLRLLFATFNDLVGEHIWSSQSIQKMDMA